MKTVYFKPEVNIHEVCKGGFVYDDGLYTMRSTLGEYICVNTQDRSILEYGYDGLVMEWIDKGYIKGYESKEEREQRLLEFPYEINGMIFNNRQELIDYISNAQSMGVLK